MAGIYTEATAIAPASKSKKKNKKKKGGPVKAEANGEALARNGLKVAQENEADEGEELEPVTVRKVPRDIMDNANTIGQPVDTTVTEDDDDDDDEPTPSHNALPHRPSSPSKSNGIQTSNGADTTERLDALARERDALRTEVSELRKSLEAIQSKHEEEVTELEGKLEESNSDKDQAEKQYQDLLGRVNTIRAQLGERLKSDAVGFQFVVS
jgi:hypothetical protein